MRENRFWAPGIATPPMANNFLVWCLNCLMEVGCTVLVLLLRLRLLVPLLLLFAGLLLPVLVVAVPIAVLVAVWSFSSAVERGGWLGGSMFELPPPSCRFLQNNSWVALPDSLFSFLPQYLHSGFLDFCCV